MFDQIDELYNVPEKKKMRNRIENYLKKREYKLLDIDNKTEMVENLKKGI